MPLNITARHVELTDEDRRHINNKVERFRKLAVGDRISVLDVIIDSQKNLYSVEVVVKASRFGATGTVTKGDLRAAIDDAMAKVERQLRKQLDKKRTRKRHSREARDRHRVTLTLPVAAGSPDETDVGRRIVRSQQIATKPMSIEEAAEQLEIEAGSFVVFVNAETDRINIIHRLEDGRFGLIEPT